ncbi:MAG TPA: TolC family protein [Gemmatimonadales bacterium]|nr:TolC family protein [Gemmatimonadales bacterium]
MLKTSVVVTLAFLGVVGRLGAQASPLRLSFADAVSRAAGTAPSVAEASLDLDQADARVREARGAFFPTFGVAGLWVNRSYSSKSFGFSFPTIPGVPAFLPTIIPAFNNYDGRFTATETLLDFSSMGRIRAAHAQVDATDAVRGQVVEGAAQTAGLAYLRAARAGASVAARRADSSIADELVGLAQAQKTAGVSAAIDVTRAETQLAVAEGLLVVALNQDDQAHIDLARALGLDPATPMELTDTLGTTLALVDVPSERDSDVALALANRPDLRAEAARGLAAQRTGSAIAAERLPRVSLEGDYGVNGPTAPSALSTRQISLEVSIPLLDGLRRESQIAEQDAVAQASAVRVGDLRQQIAADVQGALLDLRSAAAEQRIARERLRLAEEELAEARERFAAGVAGNIEVIDAQSNLVQARDADIDARYEAAVGRVTLARAVGVARTLH